ncbi:MAG: putative lipid II flippase FtsW [Nitrospinae bacterium]|nr:putative lipid II flippase FtsW [Nitrospinota bacterium]
MPVKTRPDIWIIICALLLLGLGIVMIFSSSAVIAIEKHGDSYYFLKRQGMWSLLGVLGMFAAMRFDYRFLKKRIWLIYALVLSALVLVYAPGLGVNVNGAKRWINLGFATVQPSEVAKLGIVIFFAGFLAKKEEENTIKDFVFGYMPNLVALLVVFILIQLQPDLGTAMIIGMVSFTMFLISGVRGRYLAGTFLLALPILWAAVYNVGYRRRRILSFLNPWDDASDSGYQIIQSFVALAKGGVLGVGLGNGRQKLFYLPEPHTDFIFSIIGEELGLVGALTVVGLFLILAWRGIRAGLMAQDRFSSLLALGITFTITIQALLNISVIAGAMPTKGLPLPFISLGGTALVMWLISVGLLANISEKAARPYLERS